MQEFVTEQVSKKKCSSVPRQDCRQVPSQSCRQVPRQDFSASLIIMNLTGTCRFLKLTFPVVEGAFEIPFFLPLLLVRYRKTNASCKTSDVRDTGLIKKRIEFFVYMEIRVEQL